MDRHAAHGHRLAFVFAALGQRDVERSRRQLGIVKEQLVKVSHPVKEQDIRVRRLKRQILRHHGRRLAC